MIVHHQHRTIRSQYSRTAAGTVSPAANGYPAAMAAGLLADQVSRLVTAAASVASATDLTSALRGSVVTARDPTSARYAASGSWGGTGLSSISSMWEWTPTVARIGHLPEGRVLGTITKMGETVRIGRISEHPDSVGFPPGHPLMESFLGVPVRIGGEVFGQPHLAEKPGGFTDDDQAMVEAMAVIAGAAVSTARLQQRLRRVAVIEDRGAHRPRPARRHHPRPSAVGLGLQGIAQRIGEPAVARTARGRWRLDLAIASLRRFIFDLEVAAETTLEEEQALCDRLAAPYGAEIDLESAIPNALPRGLTDDVLRMVARRCPTRHAIPASEACVRGGSGRAPWPSPSSIREWASTPPRRRAARGCRTSGPGRATRRQPQPDSAPGGGTAVRIILPA